MTNFIVETLNLTSWPNDTISTDPLDWKRRVVERCLYGVDINLLVQELAKLSLWLSSASQGKPLTFLDHHLKVGNSLYGTPLLRLENLPMTKKERQKNLFWREEITRGMLDKLEQITGTDSDHLNDVKRKGEINQDVYDLSQQLRDVAHVWLGTLFGLRNSKDKPIDENEYDHLLQDVLSHYPSIAGSHNLREARRLAEQEHFFHWEIEFPDARVDGHCQFDVIIANPPYVGKPPNQAIMELYKTAKCGDLYAWLLDLSLHLVGDTGKIGMIVPLSLMFSRDMKNLRTLLLQEEGDTYISSFDATRDGIFQPSGESRNGQRASIILHHKRRGSSHIYTTNLMRWFSEERDLLLKSLRFTEITTLASEEVFPKLGDFRLVNFLQKVKTYSKTIGSTIYREERNLKGNNNSTPPPLYHLYISGSARYFITAMPDAMRDTGLNVLSWEQEWARDVAMVALNSNVFYWLWCSFGDGFHVTANNIALMVVPDVTHGDVETLRLHNALLNAAEECATFHNKWGERISNYNFNKRMDILLDIDDWVVHHIAPDLQLPRDIFAQYKSNSFLRPLDISGILEAEQTSAVD